MQQGGWETWGKADCHMTGCTRKRFQSFDRPTCHSLTISKRCGPCRYAGFVNSTVPPEQAWRATPFSRQLAVHHMKWHAGIVDNLRDRAAWYR